MPKHGRIADTLMFIRGVVNPALPTRLLEEVAMWIEAANVSPAVDQAMSQGTSGTETTRRYRRAMILILCVIGNVRTASAQQLVAQYKDQELPAKFVTMVNDVKAGPARARLNPKLQLLMAAPANFLAHNRIKTGRGRMTVSGNATYEFSWDDRNNFYLMQPPGTGSTILHITFPGYNIAVTKFTDVENNPGQIPGSDVAGSAGLTTQLSGCTILYSVNAGNLVVAHVWPDKAARVRNNVPNALNGRLNIPAGALLAERIAHQGALSNPVGGGTTGIFGMVENVNDTGLRNFGPHAIRMHGYHDTLGNAYFIAIKVGGNWQLFGQQNNPGLPNGGVTNFQQLYP